MVSTVSRTRTWPSSRIPRASWPSSATWPRTRTSRTWPTTPSRTRRPAHLRGVGDRATFEHIEPERVGNTPQHPDLRAGRQGYIRRRAKELGYSVDRERGLWTAYCAGSRNASTAATTTSSRRLLRTAASQRTGHDPALLPPGELPSHRGEARERRVTTEATIKVHVNGDRIIQTPRATGLSTLWTRRCGWQSSANTPASARSTWRTTACASWTRTGVRPRSLACCWTPRTAARPGAVWA